MAVTNYYTVNGEIIGEKTAGSPRVDYLTDALGSVTATVNQSAQVVNTYRYKPYGSLLAKTGTGPDPAFGWVGTQGYRPTQKKFSDFYVRARHYGDTVGQWSTQDPLFGLQLPYNYGYANPIGQTDRFGLIPGITPSCQGQQNVVNSVSSCCHTIAAFLNGLKPPAIKDESFRGLVHCMQDQYPDLNRNAVEDIMNALQWLANACNSKDYNICIWCLPNNNTQGLPKGWPPKCPNPCSSDPNSYGFTPVPVPKKNGKMPLIPNWTGCDPYTDPEENCGTLVNVPKDTKWPRGAPSTGNNKCAAIALCPNKLTHDNESCATLYHELMHAGGLAHKNPGRDFIYALDCCLCRLLFPNSNSDNCSSSCDGNAWGEG